MLMRAYFDVNYGGSTTGGIEFQLLWNQAWLEYDFEKIVGRI